MTTFLSHLLYHPGFLFKESAQLRKLKDTQFPRKRVFMGEEGENLSIKYIGEKGESFEIETVHEKSDGTPLKNSKKGSID